MNTSRLQDLRLRRQAGLLCLAICAFAAAQSAAAQTAPAASEPVVKLEDLETVAGEDPSMVMPTQPLQGALGFSKDLVITPRSVTTVSSDLIDKIGIRDGDQLSRIVPGTYTVNRWGIAGSTQIRGLPADTYLRGMKRIDAQGNIRNVITMWENVEIVRGPPSPIFGNGRIGGYTNYTPKSVRGTTGRYLEKAEGQFTALAGSYSRAEAQFNYSQPFKIGNRSGGYQVFGLINDSDSYFEDNFQRDRVLQASSALQLNDTWRVETGLIYQRAINAGQAGANRVDQRSFDNGTYLRGSALVNLDTNGDGRVSEAEIQASRALTGTTPARPLSASFATVGQLRGANSIIGAPQTLITLLGRPEYASVAASPQGQAILAAGAIRYADGSAADAVINNLNNTPAGFFLNPAQLQYVPRDWSLVAIEEKADGHTKTGYLDFINDSNPDATQKLQLFYDYQKQQKESQLPFNQRQEIAVFETKYTLTRNASEIPGLKELPDWVNLNLLASANARYSDAFRIATSGDYDHRRDLVRGYTPTDTFASFIRANDTSFTTGEPISSNISSEYWETGIGLMADLTLWERLGVTAGVRRDWIDVETAEGAQYLRGGTAVNGANITAAATGAFTDPRAISNDDTALSHSISVNYKTPWAGFTPYFTTSAASSALTGTFQEIAYNNVRDGAILAEATLDEYGFKGRTFKDKLFYSVSFFDQIRTGNVIQEGESYNRSNQNKGVEVELRWLPNRHWAVILSATKLTITRVRLDPTQTRTAAVTASYLGVQDIKDASGNVIVPANAFLYGGNTFVTIPNSDARYNRFGQYPEWVYGSFVGYTWDNGISASWSGNYVDSVAASSELPDLLILPSYFTSNFSVAYDKNAWRVALTVRNAFDEEYFVPNNGSFGGTLLQPGLPTTYELSVTRRF